MMISPKNINKRFIGLRKMLKIDYVTLTIKIEKKTNDLLNYFQEYFNCSKEEYISSLIERELFNRMDDLRNFSFL